MNRLKENMGITLIALVITIIVLLILAGITIITISSQDNAHEKAVEAREKNDSGSAKDATNLLAINYSQEYLENKHVNNDEETKTEYENVGEYITEKLNENSTNQNYYVETSKENSINRVAVYNKERTQKLAEGTIQDDGVIVWDDTGVEIVEEDNDDVRIYVTNNNDSIQIKAVGKVNIKNVTFKNEAEEVVMNRTNPEETKTYEFTTKMTYAGKYTVKAYDVEEKESREKEFTVASDREYTYLYNKGTISQLAGDFKLAKRTSSYSAGTFRKDTDCLTFDRYNNSSQWADSGFLTTSAVDVSDYSTLTFKFKPTSYIRSSTDANYKQYTWLHFGLGKQAPSTNLTKTDKGVYFETCGTAVTPSNYNSTLYLTEDHYDVPIGTYEGNYYIGISTTNGYWMPQKWLIYCTEIYLH